MSVTVAWSQMIGWSMSRIPLLITATLVVLAPTTVRPAAQARVSIDVTQGTFNGSPFYELTIDRLTDMLGRPSAVDTRLVDITGTMVYYHALGLSFWFQAKRDDPQQRCWLMDIHLSRTWDAERSEFFTPFPGSLTPPATANWKARTTLAEVAAMSPIERTPEAQEAQWAGDKLMRGRKAPYHVVVINAGKHSARFLHERSTLFLERISLSSKSDK